MRFSQNDCIPDLEWHYFPVFGAVFRAVFGSCGWQRGTYLPTVISARRSSTA